MNATRIRRTALATKAGMARYPKELYASIKDARRSDAERTIIPTVDLTNFGDHDLAAAWIGHATVLLRVGGQTLLTDPVFSKRVGMTIAGVTMGVARVRPPALDIEHLPAIDAVVLSHAHFDHLDRPSLERLAKGPARGATVVTAVHTRRLIPRGFGRVVELPWSSSFTLDGPDGGLVFGALRPEHWGARTAVDRHRRFNAYTIESAAHRVLFAGDSAQTSAFDHLGEMDLSIFGIGAYDPWEGAHATPEQVWAMYLRMGKGRPHGKLLPMHHSTFVLGREPLDEPLRRMMTVAREHRDRVVAHTPGMSWACEAPSDVGLEVEAPRFRALAHV